MIRIHGTITDPSGRAVTGAMIELRALNSTAEVLAGSVLTIKCDASGGYDFQLGIGAYDVYTQNDYQGDMDYLGTGAVSAASIDGSLSSILVDGGINLTPPLLGTALDAMQRAVSSAASAASDREQTGIDTQTATEKAAAAALSESEAKAARDSIVSDAADVRQKALDIEAARQEVASNTATVSANTAATTTSAAEAAKDEASALLSKNAAKASADTAATLKADVEAIRDTVNSNVSTAVAAADTASQKAASAAQSEATASSAATRAEQAVQAVAAALIDAGPYDASTGVLPFPVQVSGMNKSCIWKVTGSGSAGGIELGVGDSLIYTTHGSSYYKIDNTESVTSVNGQKGIVSLTASNVGADAAGTGANLVQQHEAKASAHAITGVSGLQAALDGKYSPQNKPTASDIGADPAGSGATAAAQAVAAHELKEYAHPISGVQGLPEALAGKQSASPVLTAIASVVQAALGFTNAIINGDMRIVQRSGKMPISVPHNYFEYGVDRFYLGNTAGASSNVVMSYRHVAGPNAEFPWAAQAYTVSTGAFANPGVCYFEQPIEGLNLAGFIGVPLVVSFLVKSSVAGKYSVGLMANDAYPYSFITSITINAADTWEKKVVKFPLGVPAAFVTAFDNTCRLRLRITFAGNNTTTAPDAWAAGNYFTVSEQAHMPTVAGNTFSWTGVQLAVGTEEKPFEHLPYGYGLSLCQRYYASINLNGWCWPVQAGSSTRRGATAFPVLMRAIPTVSITSIGNPITIHEIKAAGFEYGLDSGTTNTYVASYTATAEI